MVKSFDGSSGSVEIWLEKMKLVARLQKIEELENFLPLYLEGAAFAVYNQLTAEKKRKAEEIEKALLAAFAQDLFSAYDSFRQRSWMPGEAVDVFLADLRRLACLANIDSDGLIRCAFICGLPTDVSAQLRASVRITSADLSVVAEQARILMGGRIHGAMVAINPRATKDQRKIVCHECGGDHPVRFCKNKKQEKQENRQSFACWNCGGGHLARNCTNSGNGQGGPHAPAVPPRV
jgi:hypothetical protein